MNKLSSTERVQIVSMLVEGNSLRSISRMADCSINTVTKLLVDLGGVCATYHDEHVRNLKARRLQADEIWCFVGAKAKNVTEEQKAAGWGDIWTWVGMDADTKLVASYMVGPRTPPMAYEFMKDLASRVNGHTQLTTDGLHWYVDAVDHAFGIDVDYAMLVKHYGTSGRGMVADASSASRYSPAKFQSASREVIKGDPDPRHISTSYIERQNLTMRMGMRRFTRLTNGFSKKAENHGHAVAIHYAHYNFAKIHKTLRITPAMAAGIADHVWSIEEIVGLLEN
jgi:IS1 family transposase